MWQTLFGCDELTVSVLTSLTTYQGAVPQGAPTSTYVANLIFGDAEALVVSRLAEKGYTYTRYIDDITISTKRSLSKSELAFITTCINQLLTQFGLSPNPLKEKTRERSQPMLVHNMNLNSGRATLTQKHRKQIRSEVHHLCVDMLRLPWSTETEKRRRSLMGKLAWLRRFHPDEAERLINRVNATVEQLSP